jgi:hypothetical protein
MVVKKSHGFNDTSNIKNVHIYEKSQKYTSYLGLVTQRTEILRHCFPKLVLENHYELCLTSLQ